MKLYTTNFAPNPRRVEIYLQEKDIGDVERVVVDLLKGEHRTSEFRRKNPLCQLPVLELEDGRVLTESLAICEYLEEMYPEPPLIGDDPWRRAQTRQAIGVAEIGLLSGAMTAFEQTQPHFARTVRQNAAIASEGQQHFSRYLQRIDRVLDGRAWLAGDRFSLADITAICAIDFGRIAGGILSPDLPNLSRWLTAMRKRPSCQL
jgi:glutathione S-transferase